MQARDRTVEEWLSRISIGQVQLPRFQRFEAWGHKEVVDLAQTVLDDVLPDMQGKVAKAMEEALR